MPRKKNIPVRKLIAIRALCPRPLTMQQGEAVPVPIVPIYGPNEADPGVQLALRVADTAIELLTLMQQGCLPTESISHILAGIFKGEGIYYNSVGEFFESYGRFEQICGFTDTDNQKRVGDEMNDMLGEDAGEYTRDYRRNDGTRRVPLPLYVRNVLVHKGTNPLNELREDDIKVATNLLKKLTAARAEVEAPTGANA